MSLTNRILIAMGAGILLGSLISLVSHSDAAPAFLHTLLDEYLVGGLFDVIGRIFVASLKLLVVPLVFVSLICGSSSLGASARMGPIAGKTLFFYLVTTALAVTAALAFAVLVDGSVPNFQQWLMQESGYCFTLIRLARFAACRQRRMNTNVKLHKCNVPNLKIFLPTTRIRAGRSPLTKGFWFISQHPKFNSVCRSKLMETFACL